MPSTAYATVGFKAGAGLTIIMTQLPSLFGVAGGGGDFFERVITLIRQLGGTHWTVLAIGIVAILLLLLGERFLPGRPVGLTVVAGAILLATFLGLPSLGVPVTGEIPTGLPGLAVPTGQADGIPVGVQLVAARFREDVCLAAAEVIEARSPATTPIDPRD